MFVLKSRPLHRTETEVPPESIEAPTWGSCANPRFYDGMCRLRAPLCKNWLPGYRADRLRRVRRPAASPGLSLGLYTHLVGLASGVLPQLHDTKRSRSRHCQFGTSVAAKYHTIFTLGTQCDALTLRTAALDLTLGGNAGCSGNLQAEKVGRA